MAANIFQSYLQQPKSVLDYQGEYDQADARKLALENQRGQNALLSVTRHQQMQTAQQAQAEQNALQKIASQYGNDPAALVGALRASGMPGLMTRADTLETQGLTRNKTETDIAESKARAGKTAAETAAAEYRLQAEKIDRAITQLSLFTTPQDAIAHLTSDPSIPEQQKQAMLKSMPQDPAQFKTWRLRALASVLDKKDALAAQAPTLSASNLGGSMQFGSRDPLSGELTVNNTAPITQSADNVATNARIAADSAASRAQADRHFKKTEERLRDAAAAKTAGEEKPLPPAALKMQQEALDAIGVAGTITADLASLEKQIDDGKLKFGPVSNLINKGRNLAGVSSEESRNLATFKSSLERLRNESLRLNAGVQTDGDAQRAWNELFENINDTSLVKQRLSEIQRINKRGADLQRLKVDSVRANYGKAPLATEDYASQPAAVGGGMPAMSAIDAELARRRKK
jgi:hypothetical protein